MLLIPSGFDPSGPIHSRDYSVQERRSKIIFGETLRLERNRKNRGAALGSGPVENFSASWRGIQILRHKLQPKARQGASVKMQGAPRGELRTNRVPCLPLDIGEYFTIRATRVRTTRRLAAGSCASKSHHVVVVVAHLDSRRDNASHGERMTASSLSFRSRFPFAVFRRSILATTA